MTPEPRAVRTAAALHRWALRLLPGGDRPHEDDVDALGRELLRRAWERGRLPALLRVTVALLVDVVRRGVAGRRQAREPLRGDLHYHRPLVPDDPRHARSPLPGDLRRDRSRLLGDLRHDVRAAFRSFSARPAFTLTVVGTLALGIGATTAVYSVAHATLQRPLPFRDGERLVRVYQIRNGQRPWLSPGSEVFLAVAEEVDSFDALVGHRYTSLTLAGREGPERVVGIGVTAGWVDTLGVEPFRGRGFTTEEFRQGRDSRAVVLAHHTWQERFGGDPAVTETTIRLDGAPYTVVGIMPPGFRFPYEPDLWFPLNPRLEPEGRWSFNVQAHLRDGVDLEEARAELAVLGRRLHRELPSFGPEMELTAIPTRQVFTEDGGATVAGLLAAVGFLLLVACANVGGLMLARSVRRSREIAVRAALGAGRRRILRQLVTENLLLSLIAGAVGLGLAVAARDLLMALIPGRLTFVYETIPLDGTVLAFAVLASAATGLLFGVPVGLRGARHEAADLLRSGRGDDASASEHRLLDAFVVAELALVMVLLTGAGLAAANLRALQTTDLGYDSAGIVNLNVTLDPERYPDAPARARFARRVRERLETVVGVRAAGITNIFPTAGGGNTLSGVVPEGRPGDRVSQVNLRIVTPGFLEALGLPLLRGRMLADADRAGSPPVTVIDRSLAERLWPGEDAVGKRLRNPNAPGEDPVTVVGVVGDLREFWEVDDTWYLPWAQSADSRFTRGAVLTVHAPDAPADLVPRLRRAVWQVDPALPVFDVATVSEMYGETLEQERTGTLLMGGFAAFGLLLGLVGLYGLVAFSVGQRRREIGVRIALGARPADVVRQVVGRGLARTALGTLLGLAGAAALSRILGSLVTEIDPLHPGILAAAAGLLAAASVAASIVPARRAARFDPAAVLRADG